jgi:hypothetical protein
VVESANKLKLEAAEIDKELNYIGALRNNLKAQEAKLRNNQTRLQANPESTAKDYADLSGSFGQATE